MQIVKVTGKGQLTLPIELRRKLRINKDDYLSVEAAGEVLTLWDFIGKGSSGTKAGSTDHDSYIAEEEQRRWLKR